MSYYPVHFVVGRLKLSEPGHHDNPAPCHAPCAGAGLKVMKMGMGIIGIFVRMKDKDDDMSESEDEYPTDEELGRVVNWPYTDVDAGLEYCVSLWHWPDMIRRHNGVLYMATGGWSGNESIIAAMKENIGMWSRWVSSTRGGAHEFELQRTDPYRPTRFNLQLEVESLTKERDEADRRAGRAERLYAYELEQASARRSWLDHAKEEWGVDQNVSFDVVWKECLELKRKNKA